MDTDLLIPDQYDQIDGCLRPGEHAALFGHVGNFRLINKLVQARGLPQALVFHGERGIGKASFALHIAANLLSARTDFQLFSLEDILWRQLAQRAHPSFLHIQPSFDKKAKRFRNYITVEDIRAIGNFLHRAGEKRGALRIVLIDHADDMNSNAANALLKLLEEPPPNVLFLLLVNQKWRLLATIRSRCQFLFFRPLSEQEVVKALKVVLQSPFAASGSSWREISHWIKGSVREGALLLLSKNLQYFQKTKLLLSRGLLDYRLLEEIASYLAHKDHNVEYRQYIKHILMLLAQRAKAETNKDRAERWAWLYNETQERMRAAMIYNFDKKSLILLSLEKIHRLNYH